MAENTLPLDYYSLIEMLPAPGCAICNLLLRDADRFLDGLLYERVNEADTQQGVRRRRGFCAEHAWQLLRYHGSALGAAILCRAATQETLSVLDAAQVNTAHPSGLGRILGGKAQPDTSALIDALAPQTPCVVCELQSRAERRYLLTLGEYLNDARLGRAFQDSEGLCLPHTRMALRLVHDMAAAETLLRVQEQKWRALSADLQTFIDRNDYRRMNEPMGAEKDSVPRAIRSLAGGKGVFGPDPR